MSEFEKWYADNKDKLHLTDRIAAQNVWQAAKQSMQGEDKPVLPDYFMQVDSDNDWFETPDDMCVIEDAFPIEGDLKVGAEYEVYASHTYKQKYRITKVPDSVNDDTLVELVSTERQYYTHAPEDAAVIADLQAQVEALRIGVFEALNLLSRHAVDHKQVKAALNAAIKGGE